MKSTVCRTGSTLNTYDSSSEGSQKSQCVSHARLHVSKWGTVLLHLCLASYLSSSLDEFLEGVSRFDDKPASVHSTLIAKLVSTALDAWSRNLLPFSMSSVLLNEVILYVVPIPTLLLAHLILHHNHLVSS